VEELRVSAKTSNIITGNWDIFKSGTFKIDLRTAQSGNLEMWERQPVCENGYVTAGYIDVADLTLKKYLSYQIIFLTSITLTDTVTSGASVDGALLSRPHTPSI